MAALTDMSLHIREVGGSALGMPDWGGGSSRGTGGCGILHGNLTSQPPQENLCQSNGDDSPFVSQTPDSGGTMWISYLSWSNAPALYPL